ncbi:replication protein P [Psychromonas sp. 14N.309.X.WAT.B.A12]|uniref:replication protein P n=1 Tax=Psychromonas sp. 14N.309.X.WAT.B.A12 TaxID=2998322 RepID=UPI0025B11684|nr:replication protein P [Psychromonas sp. 14N.309.X.WAT.B.A12]MDN2661825.1 replication protein P [Psychromonas sp. 14N.309.X.WAT.B.A12]
MKNINSMVRQTSPEQVIHSAQGSIKTFEQAPALSHETSMLVNRLFSELQAIFPAWRNTFPTEESLNHAKRSWVKGFLDAGIRTLEQIRFGVKHARLSTSPYWPALGAFIEWCKPKAEDFGLPCREDAYAEAIANLGNYITAHWSHVAVQEAVRNTTTYVLKNKSEHASRNEFYRNYSVLVKRVMSGESLHFDVPKSIAEKPAFCAAPRDVELNHIANMKKMVGLL